MIRFLGVTPRVGTTLPENKATTRYSEQESVQVLLLRNIQFHPEGGVELTLLEGGNTLILPTKIKAKDKNRWRELAVCIMQQIVTVVQHHAPAVVPRKSIDWLSDYLYLGNKDHWCLLSQSSALRSASAICSAVCHVLILL